jgi:hypothetical protein
MKARIAQWRHIFDTDDNAITKALSKLTWDLAAFTCVVEMVRQAPTGRSGSKRLNGMVFDMLASGFWNGTMQGVRRLVEREAISGPRSVCSLGSLVQDVQSTRSRLTRRVFVEDIGGLNYNYRATEDRYWEFIFSHPPGQTIWTPREFDEDESQQRHAEFDWLSGTTPGTSRPDDLIREEVFDALDARLKRLDGVVEHVNAQIAHAATEASRQGRVLTQWGLNDAKGALKELTQIAQLVGHWFCNSGVGTVLPHPQFDQFQHLEQPLFTGDVETLQAVWDALESEISRWHDVDHQAL